MGLPKPGLDAVPFTPLTAQFLDDMNENIESLSDGTGFEDGAIGTAPIGDEAVTGDKIDKASVLSLVYPVGSIYINATSSTNPATLLGFGTWAAFGGGRVPVGFTSGDADFNAGEKEGGNKSNTHNHWTGTSNDGATQFQTNSSYIVAQGGRTRVITASRNNLGAASSVQATREDSTYNETISLLQPYITVYMWKRTA